MDSRLVLRDEPLRRGGEKPHNCELLFRHGETTVYVCRQFPKGLTDTERAALVARDSLASRWTWRAMQRDPQVFVCGRVSHADHATLRLNSWHHVLMNTEAESRAQTSVAFLD